MANETKKSLVEEALLQMKNLEEVVSENAKGILASTMKEEISELVKESMKNEAEEEVELDDIESEEGDESSEEDEMDMDMDMEDEDEMELDLDSDDMEDAFEELGDDYEEEEQEFDREHEHGEIEGTLGQLEVIRQLADIAENDTATAAYALMQMEELLGEEDEAIEALNLLLKSNPAKPIKNLIRMKLAEIHLWSDQTEEATEVLMDLIRD